jgi:hypothetical protein
MGCGASNDISHVDTPKRANKSVLPPIESKKKLKPPSAKSNASADSGIEDSEPLKRMCKDVAIVNVNGIIEMIF